LAFLLQKPIKVNLKAFLFTELIGTGRITEAQIPDTGGVLRMTFDNAAFFWVFQC